MRVGGQLQAPAALPPPGKRPGAHCIGGWVGPALSESLYRLCFPGPQDLTEEPVKGIVVLHAMKTFRGVDM
jgi:hypothetical protein